MYRDTSEHVDEHDRAAAAVLMAEALLTTCDDAVAMIAADTTPQPEKWRAVMRLHDTFPDVWRALDRARDLLAARGGNTVSFDEQKAGARKIAVAPRLHGIDRTAAIDASHLDREALADAHRAVGQLKLALPSADWSAIEARTRGLAAARVHRHKSPRLIVGVTAAVIAAGVCGATLLPNPAHARKVPHAVVLQQQLSEIKEQRHAQIDALRPQVAKACEPGKARTFAQLLVMDGRGAEVADFAADYAGRCGEDPIVESWANAPLPNAAAHGEDVYVIDFPALEVNSTIWTTAPGGASPVQEAAAAPEALGAFGYGVGTHN